MEQSLQVIAKQKRLERWTARIAACRGCGMTVREWCRENSHVLLLAAAAV